MSTVNPENSSEELFSEHPDQLESPFYYREKRHFRAFLRKMVTPTMILVLPIVLVVCFTNIVQIIDQWIDTDSSFVAQRLGAARTIVQDWFAQGGDQFRIGDLAVIIWMAVLAYMYCKAYYDWNHAYHAISEEYVTETEKRLLQSEKSLTIETNVVVGAFVRRTLADKFFPGCGTVVVQTVDLEGEGQRVALQDVKDPYRMRSVILNVKRGIRLSEGK